MKNKIKTRKKRIVAAMMLLIFTLTCVAVSSEFNSSDAAVNKPAKVKNLKVKKATKNSIKIKYKKVKGATGYQILIYEVVPDNGTTSLLTPLVYAKKTKKTTYTIKNLMSGHKYIIRVRAYNSDGIYGKKASVKASTKGEYRDLQIVCNSCGACVPFYRGNEPGWDYTHYLAEHYDAIHEVYPNEYHGGFTQW